MAKILKGIILGLLVAVIVVFIAVWLQDNAMRIKGQPPPAVEQTGGVNEVQTMFGLINKYPQLAYEYVTHCLTHPRPAQKFDYKQRRVR